MPIPLLPLPLFPNNKEYARALHEEAVRHLEDARILHEAGRYPGSITSSMKAVELSLKAVFVLDGTQGWFDGLLQHDVLTKAQTNELLKRHHEELDRRRHLLTSDILKIDTPTNKTLTGDNRVE